MASQMTLKGLIEYLNRDGWDRLFEVVLAEHLDGVADTLDDVAGLLGGEGALGVWLSAFEDFASRSYGDKGNVIDSYLAKRAFKETPRSRAFLKALRDSEPSLYEIIDAVPGRTLTLRDVLRGGPPVTVEDGTVTVTEGWAVARVIRVLGRAELTGTWLDVPTEADLEEVSATLAAALDKDAPMPWQDVSAEALRRAMPSVTRSWLAGVLEDGDDAAGEGEGTDFVEVRFPLADGVTADQVAAVLNAQAELEKLDDRQWGWVDPMGDEADFDAEPGMIELSDSELSYHTIATIETEATIDDLQSWLGDLVGEPKVQTMALDDLLADPEMQAMLDEMDAEEGADAR